MSSQNTSHAELTSLISSACAGSGLDISAGFIRKKDFGYNWRVNGNSVDIGISDYLLDAPEDVLSDFG